MRVVVYTGARHKIPLPDRLLVGTPDRLLRSSQRHRAQLLRSVPPRRVTSINAVARLEARCQVWTALYARRLERIGLLGSGTVTLEVKPGAAPGVAFASANAAYATIHLYRETIAGATEAELHTAIVHELLHLGRDPRWTRAPSLHYLEEVVVEALTIGILARLRPDLELCVFRAGTLALPVLYTLTVRSGSTRRSFLEWLLAFRAEAAALEQLRRCDRLLRRSAHTAQRRAIGRLYREFDARRRDGGRRRRQCRSGCHGDCGHSYSARFLHALGSEYTAFGFERDPQLAEFRRHATTYGEFGLGAEFACWLRDLLTPRRAVR